MATDPKVDYGFRIIVPRSVRTEHKNLTHTQKWIYVCLKDLCGEKGTCYRSLRTLSEEIDVSIGMLSESIRKLHENGLIHAEKKRRSEGGKEVWHITITDIWQENAKIHPSLKRSQNEQTLENVQNVNNNVHFVNKLPVERSQNEQERSQNDNRSIGHRSTQNNEVKTNEEGDNITYLPDRKTTGDLPPMALTPSQIKKQTEKREAEIWAIVERERQTTYSRNQRDTYANKGGMRKLVEDDIDDATIITCLGQLSEFEQRTFNLSKFYELIPNLLAKAKAPTKSNTSQDQPVTRKVKRNFSKEFKFKEASNS